jgi:hypothetical protein
LDLAGQDRLQFTCASMTNPMGTSRSIFAFALFLTLPIGARGQDDPAAKKPTTLEKVTVLRLPHTSGLVPVYYSAGFEARALKYQKTLIVCQHWYDKQVGKHVDFTLAVLNKADWEKSTDDAYPMPSSYSTPPPIVILPARFEDFPDSADFTDDVELLVENISCHELGHIYASKLGMESEDPFLAELYANLFMVSFVRNRRPDMLSFLQGPSAKLPPERYTSMEDLQYLVGDVGMINYGWFQFQIYRLADLLLKDKALPKLLSELKSTFHDPTQRPFRYVAARLETMRPGLAKEMGPLWKPTTLPHTQAQSCRDAAGSGKDSDLVVVNTSLKSVKVTSGKDAPVAIASNSWYTFSGHSGAFVRTDSGACFIFGNEPSVARLPAK